MAHDEIGFSGLSFLDAINRIPDDVKVEPTATDVATIETGLGLEVHSPFARAVTVELIFDPDPPGGPTEVKFIIDNVIFTNIAMSLSQYFVHRNFNSSNPIPNSWEALVIDMNLASFELNAPSSNLSAGNSIVISGVPGTITSILNPDAITDEITNHLITVAATTPQPSTFGDEFITLYRELLGIGGGPGDPVGGDADGILLALPNELDLIIIFENITHFLREYSYSGTVTKTQFLNNLVDFMTTTVTLKESTTIRGKNLLSYEEIFKAFYPVTAENPLGLDSAGRDFTTRAAQFINGILAPGSNLYQPSAHVDEWFQQLQDEFLVGVQGMTALDTSKSTEALRRTTILLRIFALLVDMITILQKVAATQAERLTFLTRFQEAYTELLNQVPVFLAGSGNTRGIDGLGADGPAEDTARQDLNTLNATISEQIRGRRGFVQDRAKALQSSVNQSNDAVTQQANIATSIIQQLSTLLGSIFR